jgi:transcriptional regulator with XRE-family HTH domain
MSAPALRALMTQHNLTRADVARLLGLEVRRHSHGTVDAWLSGRRNMPAAKLELLRLKLSTGSASDPARSAPDP